MRLLGDNESHDQIDQRDPAEAREESQHGQQTYDGRVNAEVVAQACAHARDHAVGCASGQLFVVGVHVALLSMISRETYAGVGMKLQTPPQPSPNPT